MSMPNQNLFCLGTHEWQSDNQLVYVGILWCNFMSTGVSARKTFMASTIHDTVIILSKLRLSKMFNEENILSEFYAIIFFVHL